MDAEVSAPLGDIERDRAQRRALGVLSTSTILGGLGIGASISAGALLIIDVTGNHAISGFGTTMNAVGAAVAGMPLAKLAASKGRRIALVTGNLIAVLGALLVIFAAGSGTVWLLFGGLGVLGVASAVQLQARFSAADLALPERRARDLSLVVWSITIGAVSGPNLITPGERLGEALGLPGLAGVFAFSLVAQIAAGLVVWFGLRPDPLLAARSLAPVPTAPGSGRIQAVPVEEKAGPPISQFLTIALIALAHAVMVGIMSMTPLHLTEHGGTVTLVGFTISLHIAGMYALSPVFGWLAGKVGAMPVLFGGFAVLGVSALGTAFGGRSTIVIQLALVLLGIGWSMVTVVGAALLTSLTPIEARPRRQGQSDTIMNASGAAFGAASGAIFAAGGFLVLSAVAGVLIVVAVLAALWLMAVRR